LLPQESAQKFAEKKLYPDECAGHIIGCRQPPYREMFDDAVRDTKACMHSE
jgi:hypothetical protein